MFRFACCLLLLILFPSLVIAAPQAQIHILSQDGSWDFFIPTVEDVTGVSTALADLGSDNIPELIVGNGLGASPEVRLFRKDGSLINKFLAYAPQMGLGLHVAVCDLTGDGINEIITSPQRGGGPHIRVFDSFGRAIDQGGFFAYAQSMKTGVNLVCADVMGDTRSELITLPQAGAGPHVRVWSWNTKQHLETEFFVGDKLSRRGLTGVVHEKKLLLATEQGRDVEIFSVVIHNASTQTITSSLHTLPILGVSAITFFHDEFILTSTSTPTLFNITKNSSSLLPLQGSVHAVSDNNTLIFTSGRYAFHEPFEAQHIEVDVSQQRLYAFTNGILDNTFLISSGKNNASPLGNHKISEKLPLVHYAWFYGVDSPNNYDLGRVPYNLRFAPHIYIHYAPWHNNFGKPMSRGCVNVSLEDMQWIYAWAQVGTTVVVHP